jgi:Proteolysis_6 C-terminal
MTFPGQVCLICGEVLNAGGRSECTRHAAKCGAGAGLFFLLQECSGLIMHKNKAAYIHSPYVDSHGETPQYRGRPLNLDLDRYEHLREVWFSHGVRQKVMAERGISRQVILPDFY